MSEKNRKIDPKYIPSLADRRIREAMEKGLFDDLPGAGKPILDLEGGYDPEWWTKQWVKRERLSREELRALPEARRNQDVKGCGQAGERGSQAL